MESTVKRKVVARVDQHTLSRVGTLPRTTSPMNGVAKTGLTRANSTNIRASSTSSRPYSRPPSPRPGQTPTRNIQAGPSSTISGSDPRFPNDHVMQSKPSLPNLVVKAKTSSSAISISRLSASPKVLTPSPSPAKKSRPLSVFTGPSVGRLGTGLVRKSSMSDDGNSSVGSSLTVELRMDSQSGLATAPTSPRMAAYSDLAPVRPRGASNVSSPLNPLVNDDPNQIRVRSKVSNSAKPLAVLPSVANIQHHARARTISSSSPSTARQFALSRTPSTTLLSRSPSNATLRGASVSPTRTEPPPLPPSSRVVSHNRSRASLTGQDVPPHSPPSSTLSSRSSRSASSSIVSNASRESTRVLLPPFPEWTPSSPPLIELTEATMTLPLPTEDTPPSATRTESPDGREVEAEARSNRKIKDLEITNESLLGINSILEATKVRQAREIRDLRRKLRESQLVLPPRTFKELQTTHKDPDGDGDRSDPPGAESSEEDGEIEDPVFNKLKLMIEGMVIRGLHAVESKHEVQGGSGVKVLSAAELEEYDPLRDSTRSLAPDELNLEDDDDCPGRDDEHLVGREQAVSERWARGDGSQRAVSPLLTITPVP